MTLTKDAKSESEKKMKNDLTGKRFDKWVVLGLGEPYISKEGQRQKTWRCKCDCGTERDVVTQRLLNGRSKSCGECSKPDLTGQDFWSFHVIQKGPEHIRANGKPVVQWECKCICGNIRYISTTALLSGKCKSCGCMHDEYNRISSTIHGDSHTRLHNIWSGMRARCYSKSDYHYRWYGERGIKICDQWKDNYAAFKEWALNNGYSENLTIDRINVNGDYEPTNCRWATMTEQTNNTRRNVVIEAFGEKLTLSEWSRKMNIDYGVLKSRIRRGWSAEDALTKPKRAAKNKDK